MSKYNSLEEILNAANSETIQADTLDILISKTRELSALKQREVKELEDLLERLEARLASPPS